MATLLSVGIIQSPDAPLDWETSTVINKPQYLTFKWSTTDQNVSARWHVNALSLFGPQQVASGVLQSVPMPGHSGQFTIDFNAFAPESPAEDPTFYEVTVSTYPAGGLARAPISTSFPVKVIYQKSTQSPIAFDADLGFNWRTIKIALTRLDAKKDDDANTTDEPYLIMVRFRFRTTLSASGVATPVPGTLEVGLVGSGSQNNLGHSGDNWFKAPHNYDITSANLVVDESVPTGQPGWFVGAVIVFFDEDSFTASTVAQFRDLVVKQVSSSIGSLTLSVNANEIGDAIVSSIVAKLWSSFELLNLGFVNFLSGILELIDPDDFGGVNVVTASTVPGGRVRMSAGPPSAGLASGPSVVASAPFALTFPVGNLSKVPWQARYTGKCIVRGTLSVGLK
jgi:hypothetical protein